MNEITSRLRDEVMMLDQFTCVYCGKRDTDLTLDHVIPRSQDGPDSVQNLVACCGSCNSQKGGRTPYEAQVLAQYGRYSYVQALFAPQAQEGVSISRTRLEDIRVMVRQMRRGGSDKQSIALAVYEQIARDLVSIDTAEAQRVTDMFLSGIDIQRITETLYGVNASIGGRKYGVGLREVQELLREGLTLRDLDRR